MPAKRQRRPFTPEEDAFLRANVETMSRSEMAKAINRQEASVLTRLKILFGELPRGPIHRQPWTDEDELFVRANIDTMSNIELANALNRSVAAIQGFLHIRKIKRADGWRRRVVSSAEFKPKKKYKKKPHRWIMARHLQRDLRDDEHVHHINGVHRDNRLENLHLCSTREHSAAHDSFSKLLPRLFAANVVYFDAEAGKYVLNEAVFRRLTEDA